MHFFWNKKAHIDCIAIPDFGWTQKTLTKSFKQWINEAETMALSVNFFDIEPDILTVKDIKMLRAYYREMLFGVDGGIIELEMIRIQEVLCIKAIVKIPQTPQGISYIGSLTFPFKEYSYVVKIQAPEFGTTGMRASIVADKMLRENTISLENGVLSGWSYDPYDKSVEKGTLMNKSEESMYDAQFLDHPLTQVRQRMSEIINKIEFKPEIFKLKKFEK